MKTLTTLGVPSSVNMLFLEEEVTDPGGRKESQGKAQKERKAGRDLLP